MFLFGGMFALDVGVIPASLNKLGCVTSSVLSEEIEKC